MIEEERADRKRRVLYAWTVVREAREDSATVFQNLLIANPKAIEALELVAGVVGRSEQAGLKLYWSDTQG